MHCLITRKIFPEVEHLDTATIKKEHGQKRQFAKTIGFALNYGGSAFTIADRLQIPIDEAEKLVDAYFSGFPEMTDYFNKKTKESIENGYILIDEVTRRKFFIPYFKEFMKLYNEINHTETATSYYGKSYDYKPFWDKYKKEKEKESELFTKVLKPKVQRYFRTLGKIERNTKNYPIQGLSGSMTKYAAIIVKDKLQKQNLTDYIWIVNLVHDEIVMESKEEYSELAAKILEESMVEAGDIFCEIVPMEAKAQITDVWAH